MERGVPYVVCRVPVTSPAPAPGALALGLRPNQPCGAQVRITLPAATMAVRCPRGHQFFARREDIREDP